MVTVLLTIASLVFKGLRLGAKVAFSRVGAIIISVGVFGSIVGLFVNSVISETGFVNGVVDRLSGVSFELSTWVNQYDWFRTVVYALSLDLAADVFLSILFWSFALVLSSVVGLFVGCFISFAPMLSEVAVAALRKQYQRLVPDTIT